MAYGVRVYYKKIPSGGGSSGTPNDLTETVPSGTVSATGIVVAPDTGVACQIGLYGGTIQDLFGPSLDKLVVLTFSDYGVYSFTYAEYQSATRKQLISVVGAYSLTGTVTASFADSLCLSNDDCLQGQKCVDGECVPCEKLVDGHGTLTLYGADKVDGTLLADSFQGDWDGSNTHEFYLPNGTPYAGALVIPNGIQGNLKISAFYGITGSASWSKVVFDGAVNQQKVEFNYPPAGDLPFGCLYSAKVLVEVTNYVGLGDCADDLVEPEEPVAPEPPIIEEPETPVEPEPETPIEKEEHEGEPTEPVKPDKPDEPANCDCENYIAKSVQVGSDQIFDMLGSLKDSIDRLSNNLTKDVDRVSLSINQAANVNNVALSAINSNLYNLLMFMSEKLYTELVQFRQDFNEKLSCGDRGLACIVEKATLKTVNHPVAGEIEVGLVDSVIDFAGKNIQESVEEIEPVHIENEFRVQSRRTENFIDES